MKKHLLAVAIASAIAAPAMAQNVTVYGIIDAGYQSHDSGAERVTRPTSGALATSRLGFRGTEDLGGGLKANFQLEAWMNNSAGAVGATGSMFNREAWAGLSGSFGEIRLGQQDVTYAQDIDSGVSGAGNLNLSASIGGSNGELGSDQASVIKYITPTVGGFSAQVGYSSGHTTASVTDAKAKQVGAFAQYANGPIKVMAGWQKNSGTTTAAEQDMQRLGVAYDFGFMSVGLFNTKSDVNLAGDVKITQANAKVPLGGGLAAHAVYATAKVTGDADNKGSGYILALSKELSKRTTVYGAYTDVNNKAAGRMGMTGVTAPAAGSEGNDPSAVTVGIVHSF